jgi:hypothetical protein
MGPILFVLDVSDTAPLPNTPPLPIPVQDPFQVRSGKIGGQLALTVENAKRDGVRVSAENGHCRLASKKPASSFASGKSLPFQGFALMSIEEAVAKLE